MRLRLVAILLLVGLVSELPASNVAVRYREGLTHGFLVLMGPDGERIAEGDLVQVAHGNEVTARLTYHFKDGSLQDETTRFSQRHNFRLISDHLIQKGPAFAHPMDVSIDMLSGRVTVRTLDDKGQEKVEDQRMKLPPDLSNGLVLTLLKNVAPGALPLQLSMVVATPKPRIVKLSISSPGKDPFLLAGSEREAVHYVIKVEIGGIAGLIAPWLGKEPPDSHVWITSGEGPTFVKSETLSYLGGPMWRTELLAPTWPKSANSGTKETKQ